MFAPSSLDSYTNELLALVDSINRANNHALLKSHVFVAVLFVFVYFYSCTTSYGRRSEMGRGMRTLFFVVQQIKIK